MQLQSVLHIPLSKDAYVVEEHEFVVRLHCEKNDLSSVKLYYGDRVCMVEPIMVTEIEMEKTATDQLFDYYEARVKSPYTRVCYYFRLQDTAGKVMFYSEYGFSEEMKCHRTQYFQLPYLHRADQIQMLDWTKNMVMYHIFPDSFADGKRQILRQAKQFFLHKEEAAASERFIEAGNEKDLSKISQNEVGQLSSVARNGGTLRGVIENLDYIESLGANCLYLNPIFLAASYHKYDTIDYLEIDPCFGTKENLIELVKSCHERGMKVILDGVFNHCGSGFFAFQDVLEKGEDSQYCDWFYDLKFPIAYKTPPNYEAFAYVKEMPKLNTANPKVADYFCEVGRYWIREADIDGWRLDVANEINHEFWRAFRRAVREEKSDCFLIGEIWEDSTVWLQGDQFDSTMNYNFSYICREFFAEQSIGIKEFDEKIHHMNLRYPETVALAQMNFLDTHDVPRFLSYCEGDLTKFKLAVFYMMMAVGIPSVFYGDEKGIMGVTEAEYRHPMPWEKENMELEEFYQKWTKVRREHKALCQGNYRTVLVDEKHNIYVFSRTYKDEQVIVAMNFSQIEQKVLICENNHVNWYNLENLESGTGNEIICAPHSGIAVSINQTKEE